MSRHHYPGEPPTYRCDAMTKSGKRCRLSGPHGRCRVHRRESVDEEMRRIAEEVRMGRVAFDAYFELMTKPDPGAWEDVEPSTIFIAGFRDGLAAARKERKGKR